ncbi:MAG: 50S ribosomal protein L28 [Bacilli bacterium]|nr:50S ribosomal protein L28 [Bacilli bacterium]
MSRYCQVTGKGPVTGNNRSHSLRATRRRWNVNLQKRKVEIDGQVVVVRMSNRAYRTLKKSTKAGK